MKGTQTDLTIDTRAFAAATRPFDRLVIPVQGSDEEYFAQQWVVEFAASAGIPIQALHVASSGGRAPRDLFSYLRRLGDKWGVKVEALVLEGEPLAEILKELTPRDLVVIGTRRLATQYHLGSLTADLIRHAPCPVQVVRIP
ncbi:MAG: universal stress protein [Euryarchaeota archaeon]|nr:universal stress protein [Euryarchaeota archaeon]